MSQMFTYTLNSLSQYLPIIWDIISKRKVIVLEGDLGAGKTTFLIHLFNYLKVQGAVSSPTFSIINEYDFSQDHSIIYHLDLYRINNIEELFEIGFEELFEKSNAKIFIEWPQLAIDLLPQDTLLLKIHTIDAITRQMEIMDYFSE